MKELYSISDASRFLKKNRLHLVLVIGLGVLLILLVTMVLYFTRSLWAFLLLSLALFAYISYVFTYSAFFRKENLEAYHFLAQVEQFERMKVSGSIKSISSKSLTLANKSFYKVILDNDTVIYLDEAFGFCLLKEGYTYSFETIEQIIVAYKETKDE